MNPGDNETRGEFALLLDGVEYVLRPTYEAIVAIEKACARSISELARAAFDRSLSIEHAALVAVHCIRAWGRETGDKGAQFAAPPRIGSLIVGAGTHTVFPALATALTLAATGGVDPDTGKARPEAIPAVGTTTSPETPADA